jgi:hypothetical protein
MKYVSVRCSLVIALAVSICVVAKQGHAEPLCIDNATDLFNTLKAYSDGGAHSGEDLDINLVLSDYEVGSATGNKTFKYSSTASTGYISLNGGWNSNCTEKLLASTNVILDGNGIAQVLKIDNAVGGVYINQLVIQNGETSAEGAGLAINTVKQQGGIVEISDSIIRNNHSSTFAGGLAVYSSGGSNDLDISNNLIVNNSADVEYGAVYADGDSVSNLSALNNTVYGNTTVTGSVGGMAVGGRAANAFVIFVASNILAQNTKTDLYMIGTSGTVQYNDYGSIDGVAPTYDSGNVSKSPKFVDAAGGDFHLSGASPVIGLTASPGNCYQSYDLAGFVRNYYSDLCDPGAYAETIFAGAFDPL